MKIQVLMSTYNGERYLREQIDSILDQDFALLKPYIKEPISLFLMVRDDGSKDATKAILSEYADSRKGVSWYTGPNMGPGKSFWNLVRNSSDADYYLFADQDDVWLPEKIARGILALLKEKNREIPLLYCSAVTVTDAKLNPLGYSIAPSKIFTDAAHSLIYSLAPGCTFLFNKYAMEEYKKYDQNVDFACLHDWLAHKIAALTGKVIFDKDSYILYRQHGDNVVGAVPGSGSIRSFFDKVGHFLFHNDCVRSNTAKSLLEVYGSDAGSENRRLLRLLAEYRKDHDVKMELMSETVFKTGSKNDFLFKTLVFMEKV